RSPFQQPLHGPLNLVFRGTIDRTGRVIQNQHPGMIKKRTRNRQSLTLPATKGEAALADDRVIPIFGRHDELMSLGILCSAYNLFPTRSLTRAKGNVLGN